MVAVDDDVVRPRVEGVDDGDPARPLVDERL
jgi:hypothetical protein